MRKYAYLKEPFKADGKTEVRKIMLYACADGVYLFLYGSADAQTCSADLWYESPEDVYDAWNALIDERGWTEIGDPPPGCQHDAFSPVRVKGRDTGRPEWGKTEILENGEWKPLEP